MRLKSKIQFDYFIKVIRETRNQINDLNYAISDNSTIKGNFTKYLVSDSVYITLLIEFSLKFRMISITQFLLKLQGQKATSFEHNNFLKFIFKNIKAMNIHLYSRW